MADNQTNTTNQDLTELLRQSPFGVLFDIPGVDGVEDIFGNVDFSSGNSPFGSGGAPLNENSPYGGNPFAGDNFWNFFAGGVNPSNPIANNPNPVGLPIGTNNPNPIGLPIGINDPTPIGLPIGINDPTPGALPGRGVDTSPFPGALPGSSVDIPPFFGDRSLQGLPSNGSSTPVPEPSSILGLAVIGVGVAASKFRARQRRAVKVFYK